MKKKKILTLLCAAMTATALMTACGGSSSEEPVQGTVEAEDGETTETAEETGTEETQEAAGEEGKKEAGKPEENGSRVMGKVTAVNGNEVTIANNPKKVLYFKLDKKVKKDYFMRKVKM